MCCVFRTPAPDPRQRREALKSVAPKRTGTATGPLYVALPDGEEQDTLECWHKPCASSRSHFPLHTRPPPCSAPDVLLLLPPVTFPVPRHGVPGQPRLKSVTTVGPPECRDPVSPLHHYVDGPSTEPTSAHGGRVSSTEEISTRGL